MVKTKKRYGFSVSMVYILVFLSAIAICIVTGCSSKKDETNAEKYPPAKSNDNIPSADKEAQESKPPTLPTLPILPSPDAKQAADVKQADTIQTAEKINKPPEVKIPIDTLLNEFNKASGSERKIELLKSLPDRAFDRDPCIIGIVQTAVAEQDADVALAAIELLQGYESPKVLPAIVDAMAHPNEEVRRTAVGILLDINDPQAGDLLATALSDKSEDIRDAALDITRYKDKQIQFRVLETAISCLFGDIKEKSVFMLENIRGHRSVDILIEALRDEDAEFREKVGSAISMLLDEEFESYKEAKTWWEKNRDRYDEDLSLIEDEQGTQDK
jgi:HEAT repeat protein